jgi:hypothetical protein
MVAVRADRRVVVVVVVQTAKEERGARKEEGRKGGREGEKKWDCLARVVEREAMDVRL